MFLSRLSEISEELLLLNQQKESLEQRETSSAEVTLTAQNLNTRYPDCSDTDSQKTDDKNIESFLSQALYPDETLLNCYAAMIYTSTDNGRIFQELDGASICNSCGEKTVLCPHKVGGSQVIRLPKDCTHITICRPRAHQTTMEAKIAASRAMSPKSPGNQSAAANSGGRWARHVDFSKLEKDFEKQLKLKRDFPRMISLDLCVSLSQRLIVTMIHQLEGTSPILHIQETVLEFFTKRYVNEDISSRGLQDFLTAVVRHSPDSKVLYLLGSVLQRDLDPTVLCYVLLKAEMVSLSPLTDMDQFQVFLHKQYPFLEETERDSLVLEFTAYSRRCVSPPAVMGFILEMILTQQDPLITECEDVLSTHTKTQPGYLTVEELSEALHELCPLSSKMQTQSLIQRSVALSASSLIPLHKAAQLAAYKLERDRQSGKSGREHHEEDDAENKGSKGTEYLKEKSDLQFLYNILHVLRTTGR
ncbi:uncharacterized protein LOC142160691 isoform X2 [Mixophyes fleayi]|uniref:uncharacterized protein LOC142160691 isoform X2 n=1 Tax=Mixophyes fleayi TaxID=3061075 RepID=UPI003F4E409D